MAGKTKTFFNYRNLLVGFLIIISIMINALLTLFLIDYRSASTHHKPAISQSIIASPQPDPAIKQIENRLDQLAEIIATSTINQPKPANIISPAEPVLLALITLNHLFLQIEQNQAWQTSLTLLQEFELTVTAELIKQIIALEPATILSKNQIIELLEVKLDNLAEEPAKPTKLFGDLIKISKTPDQTFYHLKENLISLIENNDFALAHEQLNKISEKYHLKADQIKLALVRNHQLRTLLNQLWYLLIKANV